MTSSSAFFCVVTTLSLACTAIPVLADDAVPAPGDLRQRCEPIIGALPERMPGAERDSPELIALGRQLFFDVRLSANDSQSCNSCHEVERGGGGVDNQPTSPGAFGKRGGRNSPTVLNAGFQAFQFWDGRAADLAAQAKGPILNPVEMAMPSEEAVVKKMSALLEYPPVFAKAFPGEATPLTYDNIARAIAAFERTLVTRDRMDDFLKGNDTALSAAEMQGLHTFVSVGCVACHNGPLMGGNSYQKLGLVNAYSAGDDTGRFAITKDENDRHKFKVPTLRNIDLTEPYFHDGSQATLEEAVREMAWLQLGRKLSEVEIKQIVTFLQALTDKQRATGAGSAPRKVGQAQPAGGRAPL